MSNTGVIREYYNEDETRLKAEYFEINGIKEGEYKEYHIDGELQYICNYHYGIKEGECREYYYFDKQLYRISHYINNQRQGECREYWENGQIRYIYKYVNDVLVDTVKSYNRTGQLLEFDNELEE